MARPLQTLRASAVESQADPTKWWDVWMYTADTSVSLTYPYRLPISVNTGQKVMVYNRIGNIPDVYFPASVFPLAWSLIGPGALEPPVDWNRVVYDAPAEEGPVTLRANLRDWPSFYVDVPINVVTNGPVYCAASFDSPIYPGLDGSAMYSVSMSPGDPNWPYPTQLKYEAPFDHFPNETFAVDTHLRVSSPGTEPITSVNVSFDMDHSVFGPYPMVLHAGDGLDGWWRWEGALPELDVLQLHRNDRNDQRGTGAGIPGGSKIGLCPWQS